MWGIIPAAGRGSRIQPLAFSKELLPVGGRDDQNRTRPRAVSDYLVERLVRGGTKRLCFVISPGKSDIIEYYGGSAHATPVCYAVQSSPAGLCDAIFRALPFIDSHSPVLVGLPDTIWFPEDAFCGLDDEQFSFVLFPVDQPQHFDSVLTDEHGRVLEIQVKRPDAESKWIWGAFKLPAATLKDLFELWVERDRRDEYLGTLVNEWIRRGGVAYGVRKGASYLDVGTIDGYLETIKSLHETNRLMRPSGAGRPA